MKKTKIMIHKMMLVFIFATIVILLLEFDGICCDVRKWIESIIPFIDERKDVVSNIFIGIWGSVGITLFSEVIEFQILKKDYEKDILIEFEKLCNCIQKNDISVSTIRDLYPLETEIGEYEDTVRKLYYGYLPFNRNNEYVNVIIAMFDYVECVLTHVGDIKKNENQLLYWLSIQEKCIHAKEENENIKKLIADLHYRIHEIENDEDILKIIEKNKRELFKKSHYVMGMTISRRFSKKELKNIDDIRLQRKRGYEIKKLSRKMKRLEKKMRDNK